VTSCMLNPRASTRTNEGGGAATGRATAPTLAEGTAGVEPTGKAEKATAAKSEALVPWAQENAGCGWEVETSSREAERELNAPPQDGPCKQKALPQKGERKVYEPPPNAMPPEGGCKPEAAPQKHEHEADAPPQSSPNMGEHEPCWLLKELSHKDVPSTWEGPTWDPGGRPPRGHIFGLKRACRG
jgi:hypothetical protein